MKYAALFRGINVGGKNIVKMDKLKQLFINLGFQKVGTYIQSGNVVFETELDEISLRNIIETAFTSCFGFESNVMIRNIDEMKILINRFPFSPEELAVAEAADPQVEHVYVYFLNVSPNEKQIEDMYRGYSGMDILRIENREIYLLCHESIRKSKMAIRIAGVADSVTVRNWKTVGKIYDMLYSL